MNQTNLSNATSIPTLPESPWRDLPIKTVQCVFTILLNGFILIVFFKMKKFTFSNLLFISLSLSDIVIGVFLPFAIINHKFIIWPFSGSFCVFYQILAQGQLRVSTMILNVMTLHRFIQIVRPFKSKEKLSKTKIAVLLVCWIFPLTYITVLMVSLLLANRFNLITCAFQMPGVYIIVHVVVIDMIPTTSAIFLNFYNIYALYKKSKKAAAHKRTNQQAKIIRSKQNINMEELTKSASMGNSQLNMDASTVSGKTGYSGSKSNALNATKANRDLRATLCLVTIIVNVIITEYPYLIAYPWITYCPTCMSIYLLTWLTCLVPFFPVFNPIILIIFNPSFQRESLTLLKSAFTIQRQYL